MASINYIAKHTNNTNTDSAQQKAIEYRLCESQGEYAVRNFNIRNNDGEVIGVTTLDTKYSNNFYACVGCSVKKENTFNNFCKITFLSTDVANIIKGVDKIHYFQFELRRVSTKVETRKRY